MPSHLASGAIGRARAVQRRGAGGVQAQDAMARRHHPLGDVAAGVHSAAGCAGAMTVVGGALAPCNARAAALRQSNWRSECRFRVELRLSTGKRLAVGFHGRRPARSRHLRPFLSRARARLGTVSNIANRERCVRTRGIGLNSTLVRPNGQWPLLVVGVSNFATHPSLRLLLPCTSALNFWPETSLQ